MRESDGMDRIQTMSRMKLTHSQGAGAWFAGGQHEVRGLGSGILGATKAVPAQEGFAEGRPN